MAEPGAHSPGEASGPSVVITGASGGIGSALARHYATAGARVALLDLDAEGVQGLASELVESGKEARAVACDVTRLEACHQAVSEICSAWGGIDTLINNAGITHLSRFRETEVDVIRRVMEVNFFGAVNCTRAALETLVARRGRIVVLSSIAGVAPLATRCGYAASKHALHGFFESLGAELQGDGVSVTMVCPSFVETGIGDRALGGDGGKPRMERTQSGTPVSPELVAGRIYQAAQARRPLLLPTPDAKLAAGIARFLPRLYRRLMVKRIVPDPPAGGR